VFDIIETLKEVLATKAQAIWIVLMYALKDNQRYWVFYYRRSVIWAFFLLQQRNMLLNMATIQMLRCIICHLELSINQCDGSTSSFHGSTTRSKD
jgi:hypothetical protein